MNRELWAEVDAYFESHLLPADPDLEIAARNQEAANLPPIWVTPNQGALLSLLIKLHGSRRVLEIGTLGGYSTVWLAKALPSGGEIVTLELDPHHAATARATFAEVGAADSITLIEGNAADSLAELHASGAEPFDFIFVDADKPSNPVYFNWAMKLSQPGSLIFIDNVVRNGEVADAASTDANVRGVRAVVDLIAREDRVENTFLQTVGAKNYDGFILCRVTR